ncbi:MAG: hypothetical protein PS018_22870 [bacterium]|nr:hypothetical protein [bacterium]
MKKSLFVLLLASSPALSSPALAQTPPAAKPKSTAARVDPCTPIGKTAKGELVYALKCDNLPGPPPPPPQAEAREAPPPPPEPETRRTGLFGWSYDRRKQDD